MSTLALISGAMLILSCLPSYSQTVSGTPEDSLSASAKRRQYVKVTECLSAYRTACMLKDSAGVITDDSMRIFEDLFEANAIIVNDLDSSRVYPIPMRDYVSMAYNYLDSIGIETIITEYRFSDVLPEKYPYIIQDNGGEKLFLYDVPVTKSMLNGIDKSGKIIWYHFPIDFRIILTIHYYAATGRTLIGKIILDVDEMDTDSQKNPK